MIAGKSDEVDEIESPLLCRCSNAVHLAKMHSRNYPEQP